MKILFLYSEIAGYFLSGVRAIQKIRPVDIHIVRWPVNPEAPFIFGELDGVTFYERNEMNDQALVQLYQKLDPDLVYVTGWIDKSYLKIARMHRKRKRKVICAFDSQWEGNLRQKALVGLAASYLKKRFTHFWGAGLYQYEFARRLGISRNNILTGVYTCDQERFENIGTQFFEEKRKNYPHRLLYVGRLVEVKGVAELISAFAWCREKTKSDWNLQIVGTGPLKGSLPVENWIEYCDFVQPHDLPNLARHAGAFVLPSHFEPWGVVLHEFAAAGLPLLASRACGAHTAFVREGHNGFLHEPGDQISLRKGLMNLFAQTDEQLLEMGENSVALSRQITPATWAAQLLALASSETAERGISLSTQIPD